jgi:hypothetical protein
MKNIISLPSASTLLTKIAVAAIPVIVAPATFFVAQSCGLSPEQTLVAVGGTSLGSLMLILLFVGP